MSESDDSAAAQGCALILLMLIATSLLYATVQRFNRIENRLDAIEKALAAKEAPR